MTKSSYRALRPLERSRLHEELVERLAELVREADMQRGDRFPAERELADQLGVSRASIRQAMVALDATGFVEVRHGGGVFLRRPLNFGESAAALFERRRTLPDAVEAREALEVKLAELAAIRRSSEDLEELHDLLEQMEAEIAAGGSGIALDAAFHRCVASAAGNAILERMLEEMSGVIEEMRAEYLAESGGLARVTAANRDIFAQIRLGIPQMASAAMRDLVQMVASTLFEDWREEVQK